MARLTKNQKHEIKLMCNFCSDKKSCIMYGGFCNLKMKKIEEFRRKNDGKLQK